MADPSNNNNAETCPICLCPVEHVAIIPTCSHRFCYSCITKWAKSKLHCPLCKTEFTDIQHSSDPLLPCTTETLPPPVVALVDTTQPDLECLTDSYFLIEVGRLLTNAEKGKRELFRSSQKNRNDYGFSRLNRIIQRLNEIKLMLQSDTKFSPYEVLTELYQVEGVLQLLWSGRIDELAVSFPETRSTPSITRRYGADDYQQFEEDENDDDYYCNSTSKRKPHKVCYDDEYDYY